jgi:hypothetical protein
MTAAFHSEAAAVYEFQNDVTVSRLTCHHPESRVMPAQFKADRIIKPDVQALLKKVSVRPLDCHPYSVLMMILRD